MPEDQSRSSASRSRGAGRGGRGGGFSNRAATRSSAKPAPATTNGDSKHDADSSLPTLDDEGDVRELKQKYGSKIGLIKEMFSDWSDIDILYALQEADGDENLAVTRIADGAISQWGEVSKQKKDRSRTKAKQDTFTTTTADSARPARGGRNVADGGRGRSRTTERGARSGGGRGKSTPAATNGARAKENQPLSVPTDESSAWDAPKASEAATGWGDTPTDPAPTASSGLGKASVIPDGSQKTWASMLRQSTTAKLAAKPKESSTPKPSEPSIEPLPPAESTPAESKPASDTTAEPSVSDDAPAATKTEVSLPPSGNRLTETNLEHIADDSRPFDTETARSEAADSWSPRPSAISSAAAPVPLPAHQQQQSRSTSGTAPSGFAVTAIKATERGAVRPPGFQRRLLDQEEAVRMPGNRDQVDRAAVQFGAFSLNGPVDEDIDGDREEPETRTQPPGDSPVAHPRTSLPPAQPAPVPDAFPPQKAVSTHPAPPSGPAAAQATPIQPSAASHVVAPPPAQNPQQFGRFGQAVPQEPASFPSQKPFDSSFGPQPTLAAAASQSQFEAGFASQPAQSQPPTQPQQTLPGAAAAFSSAPGDYSSYYTAADHQHRGPYSYYGQQFGQQQQAAHGQQDALASQQQQQQQQQQQVQQQQPQRSFGGYNAPQSDNLSQYPQSGVHGQARYGAAAAAAAASGVDVQNSGNTTPNPTVTQGQQPTASQTSQAQSHGGQQQPHDYSYSHPYFTSPYYAAYMNQYQGGYNQGGYPYGKGGLYQPHQFGMSPQGPYGHASSPASGGFGQSSLHRADAGVGAGLGEYGRAGSAQSTNQQPALGAPGFGTVHDTFARGASAYQSQAAAAAQPFNGPGSQQGAHPVATGDDLKPFGDSKPGAGPSPSLASAARPGSATNNAPSQAGLPPPQSNQQAGGLGMSGYGGYPSHLQGHGLHGAQSGAGGYGMGAGAQAHSNAPYSGYGQGFGGSYYANQPRGWGGNYH